MSGNTNSNYGQAFIRPSNVLRAIQTRAISIRKMLSQKGKAIDQRAWGELDDALKLAVSIEEIASRAVNSKAEDAINSVELLELLLVQLDKKLARIFAS